MKYCSIVALLFKLVLLLLEYTNGLAVAEGFFFWFFVFVLYTYSYSIIELMYKCGLLLSNQYSMSFVWHLETGDLCKIYSLLDV